MRDQRIVCGADVRRTNWGPEDESRAEGFIARYGGLISVHPVGDAAISVTWETSEGPSVTATGATFGEALRTLSTRVLQ
jgi:hypothetical protein